MPAIRPHQKTRLHLRDSATVDFGPEDATLTVNGTVSVADDVFTFPGSASDYIDAVQAATDTSTTVYSVSGWFNADSIGAAFQTIAVHATGGGIPPMLVRLTTSSTLQFFHIGVSVSSSTVSASNWYHFAAVWDGTNIELFLNGVSQGTAAYSTATTLGTAWEIGNWTANNSHYAGKLADLRFNNYALTAGEVFDLYNGGRGYDLPERKQLTDTVVHVLDGSTDAGFYGEELTLEETTYENGVYTLSGTTPRIDMGQTRIFNEADGFAFAGWFKPTAVSSRQFLWCHGTATYIEINTSTAIRYKASDGALRAWTYTFAAGETYHIAFSNDGAGNAELWVNGTSLGTIVVNGSSTFSFSQISLNNASLEFQGDTWDNRVFDRPITAGEVANLYRKGIPAIRDAEVLRIDPERYSGSGDLIDQTGNGNDGTLSGGATVVSGEIVMDQSTGQYVDYPSQALTMADGWTWAARLKFSDITQRAYFARSSGTDFIDFFSGAIRVKQTSGGTQAQSITLVNDTETHLAVVGSGTTLSYYQDGVLIGTDTESSSATLTVNEIGQNGTTWDGVLTVSNYLLCDAALTADQIAFLASSREFADPFPEPFLGLGGETLNIQPSRYSGNGDLLDESGSGNDLTLPSGYSVADGVISSDGTADGPDTGVNVASSAASIGMWLNTTDTSFMIASPVTGQWVGAAEANGSAISSGVSNLVTYIDGAVLSSPTRNTLLTALNDGNWHHVAFTGDFASSWANDVALMQFGGSSIWRYTGELDDIRIDSTRKWSAEEIKLLASSRGVELPNTRDAKLYVSPSYDDASNGSTSTIDYSGNQNTGTLTNGPTWSADTSPDNGHRAIEFGTDQNHHVITNYNRPQSFDISIWLAPDDFSNRAFAGDEQTDGSNEWFARFTDASTINTGSGIAPLSFTVPTLTAGDWQHIHLSYLDATSITLYLNGVLQSTQAWSGSIVSTSDLIIGGRRATGLIQDFDGLIDDVLVFDRVLTPAEIAFFSGKRNPYGTAATPAPGTGGLIPIILF